MVSARLLCCTTLACLASAADEDIVMAPVNPDSSLPERLLIFIPGSNVPNDHYRATAKAIQEATSEFKLHVVIPATFQRKCIIQCPTSGTCILLKQAVDAAVSKSAFQGSDPRQDTFVAGHSMGSICANHLVSGYGFQFAGMMAFGGYVDEEGVSSVAEYPIPVMTLSGEVDGGSARPGKLSIYYKQFLDHAGQRGEDEALRRKSVHVLKGLNHASFCPGFNGPFAVQDGEAEVTEEEGVEVIGQAVSAFIHLNSNVEGDAAQRAMDTMRSFNDFSKDMCEPYLKAFAMEESGEVCKAAQRMVAGLQQPELLQLDVSNVPFSDFEHGRTGYERNGDTLLARIVSSTEAAGGFGPLDIHGASKSVDCKMLDSTRIAEQLQVETTSGIPCGKATAWAAETAKALLPARSLERYTAKGRGVCTGEDKTVLANIGPIFVKAGALETTETEQCLQVRALALTNDVHSLVFPGVQYCKLLSPSLALEWMMTDGVKPYSGASNTSIVV